MVDFWPNKQARTPYEAEIAIMGLIVIRVTVHCLSVVATGSSRMEESPATRASLLLRIRDPQDADAWQQFSRLYAGLVYGYARKRGLQDADAADLMQEVFRSISNAASRLEYDPKRGSFRGWLYTIARNKINNFYQRQRRQIRTTGDEDGQRRLNEFPVENEAESVWEREYQQQAFTWASEQVRNEFQPATWQAFWLTAVEGLSAKDVGAQLGMSPGAVYVAKSRVMARLKEQIQLLDDE